LAKLKDILYGVSLTTISGDREINISGLAFDSRKVKKGYLFIATVGLSVDGHDFIDQAVENGAVAVVGERVGDQGRSNVTFIETDSSSTALGVIAANFYDNPSEKIKLIGITGTNGKTTTATLLHDLYQNLGYKSALLSTVENKIGDKVLPTKYTTPDALVLNKLLVEMVKSGCTHAFMEVSSHALVQDRVSGIKFSGAVFTNISHDHLDYHKTFDAYIQAKKLLFDQLSGDAFALVNNDDRRGAIMLQNTKASKHRFSIKSMAEYKARIINNTLQGLELEIEGINVWFQLLGEFNAYNLITAFAVAVLLDEEKQDVLTQLSQLKGAKGRFEFVLNTSRILAIVDYAHTPDALENVLSTIDKLRTKNEQLITVVGCGGDRDKDKRPKMASIAHHYSDKVILTSDNPRNEDPDAILNDMLAGIPVTGQKKTMRILERKEAIRTACNLAGKEDIILVAGKGHEDYQEIMGERTHFDDKEILTELLNDN
jgi:UDP-N-acetylmuramoyl-L-alanyl-D-glutamate--2,6-diaminopimelate ligase